MSLSISSIATIKMTRIQIVCMLFLVLGFFIGFLLSKGQNAPHISLNGFAKTHLNYCSVFVKIFTRNLIVGFLLSVMGFISGGMLTSGLLIWNGFIVGVLIKTYATGICVIYYFIFHGPFEVYAFFLFGIIGLKGFNFYINILKNKAISMLLPKIKEFVKPVLYLFIAGLVESYLIVS